MKVKLPDGYKPSEKEPFMNENQLEYFRRKLTAWKEELLGEAEKTLNNFGSVDLSSSDLIDRAAAETAVAEDMKTRSRQMKLVGEIDHALHKIENGNYGYCEESGEPIGVQRLEARPIGSLSVDEQTKRERLAKTSGITTFKPFGDADD